MERYNPTFSPKRKTGIGRAIFRPQVGNYSIIVSYGFLYAFVKEKSDFPFFSSLFPDFYFSSLSEPDCSPDYAIFSYLINK